MVYSFGKKICNSALWLLLALGMPTLSLAYPVINAGSLEEVTEKEIALIASGVDVEEAGGLTINGNDFTFGVDPDSNEFTYYVNGVEFFEIPTLGPGSTLLDTLDYWQNNPVEYQAFREAFAKALGIPLFSSAHSLAVPTSAAAKTSRLVFNEVVMPNVQTKADKEKTATQKSLHMTRTFAGQLRYEDVEQGGIDGQIIGFNLGLAQDFNNITVGVILPYDNLDYDDLFEADRFGAIFFGQYNYELTSELSAAFTANLNYMYTDLDYDSGSSDYINTYGGGLSASITLDKDIYSTSAAVSYQYNEDDVDIEDDHQHLLKVGANAGYRIGDNNVVTVFGVWNKDITDYAFDPQDDDYFDLGTEVTMNFSETWGITIGYKKVADLENFDSDEIYLGSMLRF